MVSYIIMSQSKKGNQSGRKGGCNQVSQTIFICRKYGCNHHQKLRPASIMKNNFFYAICSLPPPPNFLNALPHSSTCFHLSFLSSSNFFPTFSSLLSSPPFPTFSQTSPNSPPP